MARLQLNKAALAKEESKLDSFRRFLPSLDMKRQQLNAARAGAVESVAITRREIDHLKRSVKKNLPMLANKNIDLTDIVKVSKVDIATQNVLGTQLPVLQNVDIDIRPYALMARPHWVDRLVDDLRHMLELRLRLRVEERRVDLLAAALRTVTQRVNLFDKILIPQAQTNIKRIRIYLGDAERAAVVRSKIAKNKHRKAHAA